MEVVQVFIRLNHNGVLLERNLQYQVIKFLYNFNELVIFKIQKDYYKANEITIATDDQISLQASTDGKSYIDQFNGIVTAVKESENFFIVEAENNLGLNEVFTETFDDVLLSVVLTKLASCNLQLKNMMLKRIVCSGTKRNSLYNIIKTVSEYLQKPVYYYYDNAKIVITDSITGTIYNINDYTIKRNGSYFTIFPIPELTLNDQLQYRDINYQLQSIIFENNKMLCGVKAV